MCLTIDLCVSSRQGAPWRNHPPPTYVETEDEGTPVTAPDDHTTVTRSDLKHRYEIRVGDVLAGFTMFRVDANGRLNFPHTEIDPAFRGRGLAQELVAQAMADAAARGETVVPHCPVVAGYLRRNDVPGLTIEWPEAPHPE